MKQEHLAAVLEGVAARPDKDGWANLSDGRYLTLYAAHDGVQLTVARVEAVQQQAGLVRARTVKGEIYVLALEDLFAAALEAAPAQTRRAGFA